MTTGMRLALDAMGGDRAPKMVIRGADIAMLRMPDLSLVIVGDRERLVPLIERTKHLKRSAYELIHTTESVAGDVAPGSRKLLGCDQRWWMM